MKTLTFFQKGGKLVLSSFVLGVILLIACSRKGEDIPLPPPPVIDPPTVTITAESSVLKYGDSTVIDWTAKNADTVRLNGVLQVKGLTLGKISTGSMTALKTYTIEASNKGGTKKDSVGILVGPHPYETAILCPNATSGPGWIVDTFKTRFSDTEPWVIQQMTACTKDDIYRFTIDKKLTIEKGIVPCSQGDLYYWTNIDWSFAQNYEILNMGATPFKILQFNDTMIVKSTKQSYPGSPSDEIEIARVYKKRQF